MSQTPQDEPRGERPGDEPAPPPWSAPAADAPQYPYAPAPSGERPPEPSAGERPPEPPASGYPPAPTVVSGAAAPVTYGGGGYAAPVTPIPTSTVVLLVLSGLAAVSCWFTLAGIAPLVLAIVAMTRHRTDPPSAARLTRVGWITFAVGVGLLVLAGIGLFVGALVNSGPIVDAPAPSF